MSHVHAHHPLGTRSIARRKRSAMTEADAFEAVRQFSYLVRRFGETSDASMFSRRSSSGDPPLGDPGHEINVQLCVAGSYGVADDFFEALRVLSGFKLPRKET